MHTVDDPPPPIIQLLLSPSYSPKFRPLTFPRLPFVFVVPQVVISKPQPGQLGFTECDGEAERRQIYFPTRRIHPMLRRALRQLNVNLRNSEELTHTKGNSEILEEYLIQINLDFLRQSDHRPVWSHNGRR